MGDSRLWAVLDYIWVLWCPGSVVPRRGTWHHRTQIFETDSIPTQNLTC